jgi:B9 domain-containing protein 1
VTGWPHLVLTLTSRDFLGRDVISGYSILNLPTQPGTHQRYGHVFSPVSSSFLSEFFGWVKGKPAEYISPTELLCRNEGREVTRVVSCGTIKVVFQVTMKDIDEFGIYPFKA